MLFLHMALLPIITTCKNLDDWQFQEAWLKTSSGFNSLSSHKVMLVHERLKAFKAPH
jgi:hypothetical protein